MFTLRKYFKNIIFVLYAVIVFFLYYSGIIKKMIHPRMYNFIIISGFLLLIFFFIEVIFFPKSKLKRIKLSNILYVIPVFLIFFVKDANLSHRLIKNKGIDIGINQNYKNDDFNNEKEDNNSNNNIVNVEDEKETPIENIPNDDGYENMELIELKDDDFIMKMMEISYDPNKNIGKRITYVGFIYRDDMMLSNQFIVGRLAMSCCAADAGLIGFLATYDKHTELKDKEWYQIKAVIDKTTYKNNYNEYELPYLKIYEVVKVAKPSSEYVY